MNALNVSEYTQTLGVQARQAATQMAAASAATKNAALKALARLLREKGRHLVTTRIEHHAVLDPQVRLAVADAVAGAVPAIDGAVVKTQRLELGDLPTVEHIDRILIEDNDIEVGFPNAIGLNGSRDSIIRNNRVRTTAGAKYQARITVDPTARLASSPRIRHRTSGPLGDEVEVGQFLGRAARGVHGMPVGLQLRDGRAPDAGSSADDRDVLGHGRKVGGRPPRSNDPLLFRARKRPEANLRPDADDPEVAYFFLGAGALRGVFLSRFALSSSSENLVATPAAGTSAFAVQTIALRTRVRWLSLDQPA